MAAPESEILKHSEVSEFSFSIAAHHVLECLLLIAKDLL